MDAPIVGTPTGMVRGLRDEDGELYRAVPYATSPTGGARFATPRPHSGWSGVRDATRPSATAPQPARDFGRLDMRPYFGPGWVPGDDYLTVDVRTPAADAGRRPVMVFVHGGGFVTGSTRAALYDGRSFARDGIVLVTLNYRLGIPGFLALEGAPANRGLLDVLAALTWVHDAIAAFGGDPANVTVVGQSAGATLVGALLGDARATGLFARAIMQSGSGAGAFTPEQAARVTAAAAAELGVEPSRGDFAPITDQRLLDVLPSLSGLDLHVGGVADPLVGLSPFAPVLPRQPVDTLADGPAGAVDLLIGTNTEEGHLYLVPQGAMATSTDDDLILLAQRLTDDPETVVEAHRAARPHASSGELRSAILGEALFGSGSARMADAHARMSGGRTHVYSFGYRSNALDGRLGAAHTVELPFVFDLADRPWLHGDTGLLGPDPAPAGLARRMHRAWVDFARTGHPGWTAHEPERPVTELFTV